MGDFHTHQGRHSVVLRMAIGNVGVTGAVGEVRVLGVLARVGGYELGAHGGWVEVGAALTMRSYWSSRRSYARSSD